MSLIFSACWSGGKSGSVYEKVSTFAGIPKDGNGAVISEPFGLAFSPGGELFISDGEGGKIWKADADSGSGELKLVTVKLDTPSALAFDKNGNLYVADTGSHTIKKVDIARDEVSVVAGVEKRSGYADGDAAGALFNAPVGIAIDGEKIYVADTYNDRIRLIENGKVSTVAGSARGFADAEIGLQAKFDTPCGIAVARDGSLLVADTGNRRIRAIDRSGKVSTLAGGAGGGSEYGSVATPLQAAFSEPVDVKVDGAGVIYIADASENTVYVMGRRFFPLVEKLTAGKRGLSDGGIGQAKFNRPSGIALDGNGNIFIADAENGLVRVLQNHQGGIGNKITEEDAGKLKLSAEAMRAAAPPRWPYDPPERKREIAGTLGEIRGEMKEGDQTWFHNGLDVVGGYGETARFVRSEKVLRPLSAQLFATLRENLRMPTLGYIHIRLGRDQNDRPFADPRFLFSTDNGGKMTGVRIRRGTKFEAGEPIGTLNSMNHVHMIAGRSGNEFNALSALELPGISDGIAPVIESVSMYDENGVLLGETKKGNERINVSGKVRIVARAYDRMDGNAERRRLGVYRLGYRLLNEDGTLAENKQPAAEVNGGIIFDKLPGEASEATKFVYANGSKSGATGETIFNYIVTNFVQNGTARDEFFDAGKVPPGNYILRIFAADFFGNEASKDIGIKTGN